MSEKGVVEYKGREIEVRWDGRLCIHIAECGQAGNALFESGRDPWCVPDGCGTKQVRETVERCPSGALTYVDETGEPELPAPENTVAVSYNGPLFANGDLVLEGAPADMPGIRCRLALCRCGQSKNKPFCDNSHLSSGFQDYGAVGDHGPGLEESGGQLRIKPLRDGPLLVNGNLMIRASSGRMAWQGTEAALCRCGASGNKPFCDGSHRKIGFKSE